MGVIETLNNLGPVKKPELVYFSSEMTKSAPAISLYNYSVKPAPEDFLLKYNVDSSFNKIYANGEAVVYEILW